MKLRQSSTQSNHLDSRGSDDDLQKYRTRSVSSGVCARLMVMVECSDAKICDLHTLRVLQGQGTAHTRRETLTPPQGLSPPTRGRHRQDAAFKYVEIAELSTTSLTLNRS